MRFSTGGIWAAQHPHCMRCASRIDLHSVYNAGTVKPVFLIDFSIICFLTNKEIADECYKRLFSQIQTIEIKLYLIATATLQ